MTTRFSSSAGSFYPYTENYTKLPDDIQEVSLEDYEKAMTRPPGYTFKFVDGALVLTPPAPPSLEALKSAALAALNAQAQAIADAMTAGYPEFEKLTWEDQRREALAWHADNQAPTPYIDALAAMRGIPREDYLIRTVGKTTAFAAAAQRLVGQRQKYEDQIKAAQTPDELAAITPEFSLS